MVWSFSTPLEENPVSCAIATEVLQVVEDENLQFNALEIGAYLLAEFKKLSIVFPIIGSIRGQGLFLGIELVSSAKLPLQTQAKYLVNRISRRNSNCTCAYISTA